MALGYSLDITFNGSGNPVFDDANFDLLVWTDAGAGDVSATIPYTLATIPEPGTASLLVACLGAALFVRRRTTEAAATPPPGSPGRIPSGGRVFESR